VSLKTWKEEFYPIPAYECKEEDALEQSLNKWIGLRKKNIDKHELVIDSSGDLQGKGGEFVIDDESCSLCKFYLHRFDNEKEDCVRCPLYKSNNNVSCGEGYDSPHSTYCYSLDHDPEPMIRLIKKAIKQYKNKRKE